MTPRLLAALVAVFSACPASAQRTSAPAGPVAEFVSLPATAIAHAAPIAGGLPGRLPGGVLTGQGGLTAIGTVAGARATTRALLFGAAKPFADASRAPIAGLQLSLRGLFEAGRVSAAGPAEPIGPAQPSEPRAGELRLVKPGEPSAVEEPRTAPAAPKTVAPQPTLRDKARKAAAITAGTLLVVIGVLIIPLPGPGLLLILLGLAMLAKYFHWAKALLRTVKRRVAAATRSLRRRLRARRLAKIRALRAEASIRE